MSDYQHVMLTSAVEALDEADAVTLFLRGGKVIQVVKLREEGPEGFWFEQTYGGSGMVASASVDAWITSTV